MKTGHIEDKLTMLIRLDELLVSDDVNAGRTERRKP